MERDPYMIALATMWLALPTTALNYWRAWDQLPVRIATHFDDQWRPNGWTSREGAMTIAFASIGFLLLVLTPACGFTRIRKPGQAWFPLILGGLVLGVLWWVNNWIVWRNLPG